MQQFSETPFVRVNIPAQWIASRFSARASSVICRASSCARWSPTGSNRRAAASVHPPNNAGPRVSVPWRRRPVRRHGSLPATRRTREPEPASGPNATASHSRDRSRLRARGTQPTAYPAGRAHVQQCHSNAQCSKVDPTTIATDLFPALRKKSFGKRILSRTGYAAF